MPDTLGLTRALRGPMTPFAPPVLNDAMPLFQQYEALRFLLGGAPDFNFGDLISDRARQEYGNEWESYKRMQESGAGWPDIG